MIDSIQVNSWSKEDSILHAACKMGNFHSKHVLNLLHTISAFSHLSRRSVLAFFLQQSDLPTFDGWENFLTLLAVKLQEKGIPSFSFVMTCVILILWFFYLKPSSLPFSHTSTAQNIFMALLCAMTAWLPCACAGMRSLLPGQSNGRRVWTQKEDWKRWRHLKKPRALTSQHWRWFACQISLP